MPVTKFKGVEKMPATFEKRCPPHLVAERVRRLWSRAERPAPRKVRPGVERFLSIAEAQQARERLLVERMRRIRRERLAR